MITRVYDVNKLDTPIYEVSSYRGETTCAAVSVPFTTLVTGTGDGTMTICSLSNANVQKVVDLQGRKPLHITISPSWGFILVSTERAVDQEPTYELLLYTINGIHIGSTCLESEPSAWTTYTDTAGFDWALIALASGKLFNFELYYMNTGKKVATFQSVVALQYLKDIRAASVVTKPGRAFLVPL